LRQLLETIGDLTGRRKLIRFGAAPPRFGDPASVVGDSLRLREFGWAPRFALEEGLRHTLRWWRERKEG
jgi:nucleoside-diphosphate-sugar epimerase